MDYEMTAYRYLRNAERSAALPTVYDSYIRHWEWETHTHRTHCIIHGCNKRKDLVGAHVSLTRIRRRGKNYHIVPMCRAHNSERENLGFQEFLQTIPVLPVTPQQRALLTQWGGCIHHEIE